MRGVGGARWLRGWFLLHGRGARDSGEGRAWGTVDRLRVNSIALGPAGEVRGFRRSKRWGRGAAVDE